eukprot:gene1714-biopygen1567
MSVKKRRHPFKQRILTRYLIEHHKHTAYNDQRNTISGAGREKKKDEAYRVFINEEQSLEQVKSEIAEQIYNELEELNQGIKYYLSTEIVFKKLIGDVETDPPPVFRSKVLSQLRIAGIEDIRDQVTEAIDKIYEDISEYTENGSGWTLERCKRIGKCKLLERPEVYTGEDCMLKFMNRMDELNEHIQEIFKVTMPMKALKQEQQHRHDEAAHCFCCEGEFGKKVRDHCHITGEYRGEACEYCNLNNLNIIAKTHLIPAVFHNLKGYDMHHIMANFDRRNVRIIANSSEKIVTPSIESASHSDVDNDEDVKSNWVPGGIKCNTFKHYPELYLVTDVVLLADVFESFHKLGLDYYGSDPAWYILLPAFAWDAMLKMTGIKLELLTEKKKDIYLLLERGIRGVSIVMKRHAKTTEHSSTIYKDANNLYGHAMSQDLPTDGFRLLSSEEIQRCDLRQMFEREDRRKGYIF